MEGVHAVEHVVTVLVRLFARCQEVEAGSLRGDLVSHASDSDVEDRARVSEDGSEQLARRSFGGVFWFLCARVDVAGDECLFHDGVSDFGG